MVNPISAAAASFAHLLGGPVKAVRAENDDKTKPDDDKKEARRADESEEDYAARVAAESENDDKKEPPDASTVDDEDDEDGNKNKDKSKKAKKAAADDEDDEKEMQGASAAARRRERARCAAIFSSAAASTRPDMAANLAFNTDLPRSQAVALLTTLVAGAAPATKHSLADRMAQTTLPKIGHDAPASATSQSATGVAARIVAANNRRLGLATA